MVKNGIDPTSVEGAANIAYEIPNVDVELATTKSAVPVLWWRVVGSSHTTFAVEAFIDEEGCLVSPHVKRSISPAADRNILDTIQQWTFRPATRDGRPVKVHYNVTLDLTRMRG